MTRHSSKLNGQSSEIFSNQDPRNLTLHVPSNPVTEADIASLVLAEFELEGKVERLVGEKDDNFCLSTGVGDRYLIKVAHANEDLQVTNLQTSVLEYLRSRAPQLAVQRVVHSIDGSADVVVNGGPLNGRAVRVTTYLDGSSMRSVTSTASLRHEIGVTAAQLCRALRDFDHPAAHRPLLWDLQHAANLRPMIEELPSRDHREVLMKELDLFEREVAPRLASLRRQVVHNDLSTDNLLVSDDGRRLTGILDFGDLIYAPLVNDVVVAATYQLSDELDPTPPAIEMIAGFHSITPLTSTELELLPLLVMARMIVWITIPEWRAARMPENRDYVLRNNSRAWALLRRLLPLPPESFHARLRDACPIEFDDA
jgi:Ser/Thr protein kinase RdoA (MazF antagonist)